MSAVGNKRSQAGNKKSQVANKRSMVGKWRDTGGHRLETKKGASWKQKNKILGGNDLQPKFKRETILKVFPAAPNSTTIPCTKIPS